MCEYLSREAVLQKFLERGSGYINELTMLYMINEIPAADVQPVVYCKDCKYAQNPNDTMVYCTYFECGTMSQNDFCSEGEER